MSKNNKDKWIGKGTHQQNENGDKNPPRTQEKEKDKWLNESKEGNDINKYYISKPKIPTKDNDDKK